MLTLGTLSAEGLDICVHTGPKELVTKFFQSVLGAQVSPQWMRVGQVLLLMDEVSFLSDLVKQR